MEHKKKTKSSTLQTKEASLQSDLSLWWSLFIAVAFLILYFIQAPSVVGDKDAGEFTLDLATNGVAHPSGYPLYIIFGHLFVISMHTFGFTWAQVANWWSSVGGALAIFFLHALAARLIPRSILMGKALRFVLAAIPVLIFGLNPIWTYEATFAEVYSWHIAWVTAAGFYFIMMIREIEYNDEKRKNRLLGGWGVICGLGMSHHLTASLVIAPFTMVLLYHLYHKRQLTLKSLGFLVIPSFLPLMSYGFVAWRAFYPAIYQWPILDPSWSSIFTHIHGGTYGQIYLGHFNPSPAQKVFFNLYIYPVLIPSMLVQITMLFFSKGKINRLRIIAFFAACVTCLLFSFDYGVPDPSSYFLAPIALSVVSIVDIFVIIFDKWKSHRKILLATPVIVILGIIPICSLWINIGIERRDLFLNLEDKIYSMWNSIPFEQGFVVWSDDMYPRLLMYQMYVKQKTGLYVFHPSEFFGEQQYINFLTKYKFDPYQDLRNLQEYEKKTQTELTARIAETINRKTDLPVIIFDLTNSSVRLLKKTQPSSSSESK
jgi:hypothetical protein